MSKQYLITTIETCQECQGRAFLTHPAWEEYHEAIEQAPNVDRTLDPYDPETMEPWFHDHGYEEIPDEEEICWACEGRGEVETTSSLDEALKDLDCFQFLGERLGNAEQWIRALNDALTEAHHQRIINACGLTDGFVTDDDGNLVEGLVSAEWGSNQEDMMNSEVERLTRIKNHCLAQAGSAMTDYRNNRDAAPGYAAECYEEAQGLYRDAGAIQEQIDAVQGE